MREVQGDLRVFTLSGRALIKARRQGDDLEAAIAAKVSWSRFEAAEVGGEGPEPTSL
jgi:hypothetical protein